jgi:hypothetical protein
VREVAELAMNDVIGKRDHRGIVPTDRVRMKAIGGFGCDGLGPRRRARAFWTVLIVASGTCLSPFFACVTPFAALATLAALKLTRYGAIVVVCLVWLANQVIGYTLLHYPWTWNSPAWGLAIGASAGLAILAARALSTTQPAPLAVSLPFMAGFAVFEFGLYIAKFLLPGSNGAFNASVVWHVFLINAVALCGLMAIEQVTIISGLLVRVDEHQPQAFEAPPLR